MNMRALLLAIGALAGGYGLYALGRKSAAPKDTPFTGTTDWSHTDHQTAAPPGAGTFTGTTDPVHVPGGFI